MKIYLVGGAVRDKLLGLPVTDRDWVVVGARQNEMLDLGFAQVGNDFPVFLHPQTKEEYALARTERKTAPGHTGFVFDANETVTLEQDLARRDLTINAIAETADGELIDPYNGQDDLAGRVLRHVSPAFEEDPLRVLRVARFAARFHSLGFRVAPETNAIMRKIVHSGELASLVSERVWQELAKALVSKSPEAFVTVLRDCEALGIVLPEIDALFGVPQPAKFHPEIDTGVHLLMCLQQARLLSDDPQVLYATLVHDVGKGATDRTLWPSHKGHETLGLPLLDAIAARLKVPNDFAKLAALVCEHHTKLHRLEQVDADKALALLEAIDVFRRPERLDKFLLACEADARGRTGFEDRDYPQRAFLQTLAEAATGIDVGAAIKNANPADIGAFVRELRRAAIDERLIQLRSEEHHAS
ncbi:MAG: multifunctional CCA addition/repair protein [Pseudohongiellaceae bacterium]